MIERIGVIADTHGLLRPEAIEFLKGCDRILHAGDIGSQAILDQLAEIAPVIAVRGNNDKGSWADTLQTAECFSLNGSLGCIIHDIHDLDVDVEAAGLTLVVTGHSHKPTIEDRDGCLFLNPGSAGPRRFSLPISAADIRVDDGGLEPRLVTLVV